jgi:hypothetical protein
MARTGDLKEDLLLSLKDNLSIIGPPRKIHEPIELDQLLVGKRGFAYSACGLLLLH